MSAQADPPLEEIQVALCRGEQAGGWPPAALGAGSEAESVRAQTKCDGAGSRETAKANEEGGEKGRKQARERDGGTLAPPSNWYFKASEKHLGNKGEIDCGWYLCLSLVFARGCYKGEITYYS